MYVFVLQVILIISGNLSFLNWLTIVPSLACFDDAALAFLFWPIRRTYQTLLKIQNEDTAGQTATKGMCISLQVSVFASRGLSHLPVCVFYLFGQWAFSVRATMHNDKWLCYNFS